MPETILKIHDGTIEAPGLSPVPIDQATIAGLKGQDLFSAVLATDELREWYEQLTGPLLLEIPHDLQHVAWESMHDGVEYVALGKGMARVVDVADASQKRDEDRALRVLVALASPVLDPRHEASDEANQPQPLDLQGRVDLLLDLQEIEFPADFRVCRHISPVDLRTELAKGADALHISAHGNGEAVALENRDFTVAPFGTVELAHEAARAGVQLAILDSCLSAAAEPQGDVSMALQVAVSGVPRVIGMSDSVWADGADVFTNHLYKNLLNGISLIEAVRLARHAMKQACESNPKCRWHWQYPVLYLSRAAMSDVESALWEATGEGKIAVGGGTARWPLHQHRLAKTFVGRRDKLVDLAQKLDPEAPATHSQERVLLTGHGGIGKTKLALQAADRLRHRFPDEVVFVSARPDVPDIAVRPAGADALTTVSSAREFVLNLGRSLNLELTGEEDDNTLVHTIVGYANDTRRLLLLDNLETLEHEDLLISLLSALGERCRVLATSRHDLPETGLHTVLVQQMHPHEAEKMVTRLAMVAGLPTIAAAKIAQVCCYTPMAIELAVAGIASGRQTEQQAIKAFEEFSGPAEEIAEYAFGAQLELAKENERLVFACAAMFPQPPRREALATATGLDEDGFGKAIEGALRLHLLEGVGDESLSEEGQVFTQTQRYQLLPLAREVASRRLTDIPNLSERRLQAAEECAEFVWHTDDLIRPDRVADLLSGGGPLAAFAEVEGGQPLLAHLCLTHGLRELEAEYLNALELAQDANEAGQWSLLPRFEQAMAKFRDMRGMLAEHLSLCKMALRATREDGDRSGEGTTLGNMAIIHSAQGRYDEAMELCEQSLKIFRDLGNRSGEADTLGNVANLQQAQGWHDKAMELYEQSVNIYRELGDRSGEGNTLNNIANVHQRQGRYEEAMALYKQSLKIMRELGDRSGESQTLNNMGEVHRLRGRYEQAMALYEQSLSTFRELRDRSGEGATLGNMANAYFDQGRYDKAMELYEESLKIFRELDDRREEGGTLNNMAAACQAHGRYDEAMELYEQSLKICRELGDRLGKGQALMNMGLLAKETGDLEAARGYWQQALDALVGLGVPEEQNVRGWLAALDEPDDSGTEK